ncbi:MAG TPA: hypothetical protein VEP73_09550, partial [Actinomycetota bacterium]|nr:hypothetical protein [Actinomycetota bacterium]
APGRQLAAAALPGVEPAVLRDRGAAAARPNDRRDPRGRPGPAPAGVLAAVVLAGAMLLPPAAVRPAPRRPRRPGRHAPAAPRAPPLLQPA